MGSGGWGAAARPLHIVAAHADVAEHLMQMGLAVTSIAAPTVPLDEAGAEAMAAASPSSTVIEGTNISVEGEDHPNVEWHLNGLDMAESCRWTTALVFNDDGVMRVFRGTTDGHLARPVGGGTRFEDYFVPCGADGRSLADLGEAGIGFSARRRAADALVAAIAN